MATERHFDVLMAVTDGSAARDVLAPRPNASTSAFQQPVHPEPDPTPTASSPSFGAPTSVPPLR